MNTAYVPTLVFWEDSSRPRVSHWNLPFWDDPGLLVWYLWIFQVYRTFYKLDVKILAPVNHEQKNSVELNRLLLKFVLSCTVGIQESSCKENAKLNFLGTKWESKMSRKKIFQNFREPKIQNFDNHGATYVI